MVTIVRLYTLKLVNYYNMQIVFAYFSSLPTLVCTTWPWPPRWPKHVAVASYPPSLAIKIPNIVEFMTVFFTLIFHITVELLMKVKRMVICPSADKLQGGRNVRTLSILLIASWLKIVWEVKARSRLYVMTSQSTSKFNSPKIPWYCFKKGVCECESSHCFRGIGTQNGELYCTELWMMWTIQKTSL
jgi:hypothetical protein